MKKRMGIFVIYNEHGKVEDYVRYLLDSLRDFLTSLIVVVNGCLKDEELDKIRILANELFIRENVGYDGGAYREVLLRLFSDNVLSQYDELVLFNDSFYGPLVPWKYIFAKMDNENVDFWGLSKWLEGPSYMPGYPYLPEHVQAYFLVISQGMFRTEYFIKFWKEMRIAHSYDEAIRNFEIAFTVYFHEHGFSYKTWLDVTDGNCFLKPGQVVYCSHMADLIEKCNFPVIKRKAISLLEFDQYLKVLELLKGRREYICEFLEEGWCQYEEKKFPYVDLEEFYSRHKKVYVFGYGKWGKALESYFRYKKWKIEGFIVSGHIKSDECLMNLEDVQLNNNVGIIVALGQENGKEIVPILKRKVQKEHLLLPTDLTRF